MKLVSRFETFEYFTQLFKPFNFLLNKQNKTATTLNFIT